MGTSPVNAGFSIAMFDIRKRSPVCSHVLNRETLADSLHFQGLSLWMGEGGQQLITIVYFELSQNLEPHWAP